MERYALRVNDDLAGTRLDVLLALLVPDLSRTGAAKLAGANLVTVDGKPAKASKKVQSGSLIEATVPDIEPMVLIPEPMEIPVLYEDDHLLVIDKPPGLVVHPGPGHYSGTLVHGLLARCPGMVGVGDPARPGIVHRLDKGTSGVMAVAKDPRTHRILSAAFADRKVRKNYAALVLDPPREAQGDIGLPVGRHPRDRKRMSSLSTAGREARTSYALLARADGVGLMKLDLFTGRTHQVRVHCSESGFPLAGDAIYGGIRRIKNVKDPLLRQMLEALDRPALHSFCLGFDHPANGKPMLFASPLPADLAAPALRIIELAKGRKTS